MLLKTFKVDIPSLGYLDKGIEELLKGPTIPTFLSYPKIPEEISPAVLYFQFHSLVTFPGTKKPHYWGLFLGEW
jgi:hypothetical protein